MLFRIFWNVFRGEFYVGNIAVIDAEVSFDYNDNLNLIVKKYHKRRKVQRSGSKNRIHSHKNRERACES
ncbi:MAG: hypothetical protein L6V93_06640 [Clostridiales bacterium]|nr:MAG: hypothetical protein L6V93_06640 [Clostridiales bacterium]